MWCAIGEYIRGVCSSLKLNMTMPGRATAPRACTTKMTTDIVRFLVEGPCAPTLC